MTVAAWDRTGRGERLRRGRVLVALGLLLLGLLPAVSWAQAEGPRGTDRVCEAPFASDFDDIAGSAHEANIRCMADHGIAQGRGDGTYAPRAEVRRDQMASFIARFLERASGEVLPPGDPDRFDDVPAENVHAEAINALAEIGVVAGRGDGFYAPRDVVRRDAMASFIRRAVSYLDDGEPTNGSQPPAGAGGHFEDVPSGNVHAGNIDALAEHGVVAGFGDGTYRPRDEVVRDQMASFVMRGYDYADEHVLGQDGDGEESEEPGTVSGTVTDAGTGDPVDGATISVDGGELSTTTTGDGDYTLAEVPPGTYDLTADAPGYVAQTQTDVEVGEGEDLTGVDFALEGGGNVAGTVTDAGDGTAIEGATVTVEDVDGATAQTDGDGTYVIEDVTPGIYTVTADADGYHPASQDEVEVVAGEQTTVDLSLEEIGPGSISGTVTDAGSGDPVDGATISVDGSDLSTTTTGDGGYTLADVPPGTYDVIADAPGYVAQTQTDVEVGEGEDVTGIDFALEGGGNVAGTVTDAGDGTEIEGATVTVEDVDGATAQTGDDGAYVIEDVTPGIYTVTADAEGYHPASQEEVEVVAGEQTTVDLSLEEIQPGSISGTVTDAADDDAAIEGATVTVEELDGASAQTDEDGGYTIEEVPPGTYTVTADAEGYHPASQEEVEVLEGEQTVADAALDAIQPGSIAGTVTDAGGEPLAGAIVRVDGTEHEAVTSDTEGEVGQYLIEGVAPGTYSVTADAQRFEPASIPDVEVLEAETTSGIDVALETSPPQVEFGGDGEMFAFASEEDPTVLQRTQTVEDLFLTVVNPPDEEQDLELLWRITRPDGTSDPGDGSICEELFTQTTCNTINGERSTTAIQGTTPVIEEADGKSLQLAHDAALGAWEIRWDVNEEGEHKVFDTTYELEVVHGPLEGDVSFTANGGDDGDGIEGEEFHLDSTIHNVDLEIVDLFNPGEEPLELRMHLRTPAGESFELSDPGASGDVCQDLFDHTTCIDLLDPALDTASAGLSELGYEESGADDYTALDGVDLDIAAGALEGDWSLRWEVIHLDSGRAFSKDYGFTVSESPITGDLVFWDETNDRSMDEATFGLGDETFDVDLGIDDVVNPDDVELRMRMWLKGPDDGRLQLVEELTQCEALFQSGCNAIFENVGLGQHDPDTFTSDHSFLTDEDKQIEFNQIGTEHAHEDEWTVRWTVEDADSGEQYFAKSFTFTFDATAPLPSDS